MAINLKFTDSVDLDRLTFLLSLYFLNPRLDEAIYHINRAKLL